MKAVWQRHLLALPTFRISLITGTLFRVGVGALPFLLPLMFQLGFGLTGFQSGMLTLVAGMGAMAMKFAAQPLLRRFGFRGVLMGNGLISAVLLGGPAFFTPATPVVLMLAVQAAGGLSLSRQFTAVNAIGYAEVTQARRSAATSFTAVFAIITVLSVASAFVFARLTPTAGFSLVQQKPTR